MVLIALGANLPSQIGPPHGTLRAVLERLPQHGIEVLRVSAFYESEAWPDPSDPPFVNAVALVKTELPPSVLMATLHEIEEAFGRKRSTPNAPRTIDLDLIDYDGRVEEGPPRLPHPRMESRAFVLVPLCDIAREWRHPVSHKTVAELIAALPPDTGAIGQLRVFDRAP
ncbi:MAG TPA: 2-amino-4-hydroxy-6-hydroxymethyldihydropteridine diphosphokinase [Rhizomicrobium sp.]|nr:2-amino-4-hydroxy-6-hydroxymethyldihydropteridine diphosphokinase [Rhizomicrobium sp.]